MDTTTYNLALLLHLLGVLSFAAGAVVAGVGFEAARRRPGLTAAEVATLLSVTRAGVVLVLAGTVVAGACGLWLQGLAHFGLGTTWVWLSIVLFCCSLALGALGGRRPREARMLAVQEAPDGEPPSPRLRALLDDPASRWANYGSSALVVVIVYLMVFKP